MRSINILPIIIAITFQTAAGITFNCVYETVSWTVAGSTYGCRATVTSNLNSSIVTSMQGTHFDGKGNEEVHHFVIVEGSNLLSIPANIGTIFPNLLTFQWHLSALTEITVEDLKPFPNLVALYLDNNRLWYLDSDLLTYNRQLKHIWFNKNMLEYVGADFLTGLSPTSVNFQSNPCISVYASLPQNIETLNTQLATQCPFYAKAEDCTFRCTLNRNVDDLKIKIQLQSNEIGNLKNVDGELEGKLQEQNKQIIKVDESVSDLELKSQDHTKEIEATKLNVDRLTAISGDQDRFIQDLNGLAANLKTETNNLTLELSIIKQEKEVLELTVSKQGEKIIQLNQVNDMQGATIVGLQNDSAEMRKFKDDQEIISKVFEIKIKDQEEEIAQQKETYEERFDAIEKILLGCSCVIPR